MKIRSVSALLITLMAVTLTGCQKHDEDTASGPPASGPAPGAPGSPPIPGAGTPPGTPVNPTGHPTPPAAGSTGNEIMIRNVKNALISQKVYTAKVGVVVNGGAITLTGSVPTSPQKTAAVAAAKQVPGVTSVKDQLKIDAAK